MTQIRIRVCTLILLLIAWRSAVAVDYRIINCGALHGAIYTSTGGLSGAWGINNRGQVVGYSNDSVGVQHGIVWDMTSGLREISIDGISVSGGYDINNNGVGIVDAQKLWNGPDIPLGFSPFGLNDSLQVVGELVVGGLVVGGPSNRTKHAAMWDPENGIIDMGIPDGAWASWAVGINNNGQALVTAISSSVGYHAYVWDQTHGMQDIGMLAGYDQTTATDINDKGEAVGWATRGKDGSYSETSFIWDDTRGMRAVDSLGLPAGDALIAINNNSQILGLSSSGLYVWDSVSGLSSLPTLGGAASYAYEINDNGWVVGESDDANGNRYACVWVPVPEPPSVVAMLFVLALASLLYRRKWLCRVR